MFVLAPAPLRAQELPEGTRVRVTGPSGKAVGTLLHWTSDTLAVTDTEAQTLEWSWAEVRRLERSLGPRRNVGRGALLGAGAMTALTIGSIVFSGSDSDIEDDIGDMLLIIALPLNVGIGAGLGALAGLVWRSERWKRVTWPDGVTPAPR